MSSRYLRHRSQSLGGRLLLFCPLFCSLQDVLRGKQLSSDMHIFHVNAKKKMDKDNLLIAGTSQLLTSTSILMRVIRWKGNSKKDMKGSLWHCGDSWRRLMTAAKCALFFLWIQMIVGI